MSSRARVTSKGQVTIPGRVRRELGIERGDEIVFEVQEQGTALLKIVKRASLTALAGVMAPTRTFAGKDAARSAVGADLGRRGRARDAS